MCSNTKPKKYIYTVTSIYYKVPVKCRPAFRVIPTCCCHFWCSTLKEAKRRVKENSTDLYECRYKHVVIEKTAEFSSSPSREWWYFWTKDSESYVPTDRPWELEGVVAFWM